MTKQETIWVKSGSGKSLLLVDTTTPDPDNPKEYFALRISEEMAKNNQAIEVPANRFFAGHLQLGNIIQVSPPKAKFEEKKNKSKKEDKE